MTPQDFAALVCRDLIAAGELADQSRAHETLHAALVRAFPAVLAALTKADKDAAKDRRYT